MGKGRKDIIKNFHIDIYPVGEYNSDLQPSRKPITTPKDRFITVPLSQIQICSSRSKYVEQRGTYDPAKDK